MRTGREECTVTSRKMALLMYSLVGMALISAFIDESILTKGTKTKEACYDNSFDETCEVLNGSHRAVKDVDWKAYDPENDKWTSFGYCNGQLECVMKRSLLSNGIKVLKVVNGTIRLQVSSKTNKDGQSRLRCRVDLEGHTPSPHEVIIKFVYCIGVHKTDGGLNLTKFLQSIVPWKKIVDIDLFDIENIKFGYCNSVVCKKTVCNGSRLWNRTTVQSGSLLLTGIEDNDKALKVRATVHLSTSTTRHYTFKVIVNSSQGRNSLMPTISSTPRTINSGPGVSYSEATKSTPESFDRYPTTSIMGSPSKSAAGSSTQCTVRMILTIFLAALFPVTSIWWHLCWY